MKNSACLSNDLVRELQEPLTLTEWRLFMVCLRTIHKDDQQLQEIRVRMLDGIITSYSGKSYQLVREAIARLKARTWKTLGNQSLFSSLDIEEQTGDVVGVWNPKARLQLTAFEQTGIYFTKIDFQEIKLKNPHSYRLYWLLKSYQSRHTPKVWKVEELRLFLLNSVEIYPNLGDFKRFLLNKVCQELGIQAVDYKRGKRILGFTFSFLPINKEKKTEKLKIADQSGGRSLVAIGDEWNAEDVDYVQDVINVLIKRGITEAQIKKILLWSSGRALRLKRVLDAQQAVFAEHCQVKKDNLAASIITNIKKECPAIF